MVHLFLIVMVFVLALIALPSLMSKKYTTVFLLTLFGFVACLSFISCDDGELDETYVETRDALVRDAVHNKYKAYADSVANADASAPQAAAKKKEYLNEWGWVYQERLWPDEWYK